MDKTESEEEDVSKRAARHIADLRSDYSPVRERAYKELQQIGPDPILDQVLKVHRWDLEGHRTTLRSRSVVLPLLIGVAGYLVFYAMSTCETNTQWSGPAFLFGVLCTIVSGSVSVFLKPTLAGEYRRRSLLRLLCMSENPQAVGALCDYMRSHSLRRRDLGLENSVRTALARLLPRVSGGATDSISPRQLTVLRGELRNPAVGIGGNPTHHRLQLAILQCIEHIGDIGSISAVERMPIYTYSDLKSTIDDQKKKCLEVLYKLRADAKAGDNLLRSSESPTAGEELLRQASVPKVDPDELLRPGSSILVKRDDDSD